MTSYILREPAYHKSAKLSAKLARIDNLGYASDLRLTSQMGLAYNQAPVSTATTETQTYPQGSQMIGIQTPVDHSAAQPAYQPVESTVGLTPSQPVSRTIGATKAPTVVRQTNPLSAMSPDLIAQLGRNIEGRKELGTQAHGVSPWGSEIEKLGNRIINTINEGKASNFDTSGVEAGAIPINKSTGTSAIKKLYTPDGDELMNIKLFIKPFISEGGFRLLYKEDSEKNRSTPFKILTVEANKMPFKVKGKEHEPININVERALTEYSKEILGIEGTGLKRGRGRPRIHPPKPSNRFNRPFKNPSRSNVKLHWSDKVMSGDNNYVLRNPFLNGRIAYYPYGANMKQIVIRTPSAHALKMVRDMVETGTFDKADYNRLMKDEGDKMNRIIKQSNVVIPHDIELKGYHHEEVADLRQRYKVLIGEITAGNHGKLVLNEMRDILRQLESYHAISAPTRTKLLKQIDAVDS